MRRNPFTDMIWITALAAVAAFAVPSRVQAQGLGQVRDRLVLPKRLQPPAGMCRIWIDGVPPARQPAPTDCVTALRDRPPNGQVVFGEQPAEPRGRGNARKDN